MTIMGGLSCHMRRQKSTRVLGSGPLCGRGAIDILKTSNEAIVTDMIVKASTQQVCIVTVLCVQLCSSETDTLRSNKLVSLDKTLQKRA